MLWQQLQLLWLIFQAQISNLELKSLTLLSSKFCYSKSCLNQKTLLSKVVWICPSYSQLKGFSKVGRVYRRLCHRAILHHATLKYSIFRFWHLPIKFDPLNPKMAFFLRFGNPKLPKSTFEVCILNISLPDQSKNFRETSWLHCTGLACTGLACTGLPDLPEFFDLIWEGDR